MEWPVSARKDKRLPGSPGLLGVETHSHLDPQARTRNASFPIWDQAKSYSSCGVWFTSCKTAAAGDPPGSAREQPCRRQGEGEGGQGPWGSLRHLIDVHSFECQSQDNGSSVFLLILKGHLCQTAEPWARGGLPGTSRVPRPSYLPSGAGGLLPPSLLRLSLPRYRSALSPTSSLTGPHPNFPKEQTPGHPGHGQEKAEARPSHSPFAPKARWAAFSTGS